MATLPIFPAAAPEGDVRALPEYLPARMVNEFSYCPRLFFYEWVEGVFQESADTVEGAAQHRRVDEKPTALPAPGEPAAAIHARSVTLSSERLRAIAKMDLVEAEGGRATPVDYKHGSPREGPDGLELWPSDKAQLAVQGIVLRDNGYQCDEGIVYYRKTGQRVRVALDEALVAETENADRAGVGGGGAGRDSASAGGFAEVSGVFAGGHLPAGRDGEPDAGGAGGGAAADGAVRGAAAEAREAPGARADDAAQRVAAAVFEHAGRAGGEVGGGAAGAREGEAGAGSADRGDLPGEPNGERAAFDAGGAGAVRGGSSDLLLFHGRVVLRHHDGFEREERVSAAQPVPAGGGGLFRAGGGAAAGGGEDSQSAHAAATEPRGAEGDDLGGIEGDGGARGAGGFAGGAAGHRGERGAAVFRGLRRDDQAG